MVTIESKIEGMQVNLHKLEQMLKPIGFVIGGNWDYDGGYFDYKMANDHGYQFLRIPFVAIESQLDADGAVVTLGRPFVLAHVYQEGNDDQTATGNLSASFNQFSEPEDPDDKVENKYIDQGKSLINQLERLMGAR